MSVKREAAMINRLLSIIYILMNKGTVTAKELAERFEVSVRTIYRDIDALGMAGIPVYTTKGRGGGISLTEQFVLNKMLVSKEEQQQILAALASLTETGAQENDEILTKLGDFFMETPENWVAIDFSDWSGRRTELFAQIKDSILHRHVIAFDYYGQDGQMSHRLVEPVQLLFKEYTWYVRAYCRTRHALRLFKVLRMQRVEMLAETFDTRYRATTDQPQNAPESWHGCPSDDTAFCASAQTADAAFTADKPTPEITILIDRKEAYRIYDRFDEEEITVLPGGDFEIHYQCALDDWVYGMILSFGPSAKVLAPESVRSEMRRRIREMGELYPE